MVSGAEARMREIKSTQQHKKWVFANNALSANGFALRIRGDSIESVHPPSFPNGYIVIVDPDVPGNSNDFVIVTTKGNTAPFFAPIDYRWQSEVLEVTESKIPQSG